ncbi:MAG: hypothetical protein IKE55_09325 [Kiritimatiellae bacterium]|nr:hypothetical protein [Kiritimatiellia bacterium]
MTAMRHAVYSGTRNVYGDMEASAKSLIANSAVDRVHFLIEDAAFPGELPDIIECHDVSVQTFFPPDGPNMRSQYTYMALMRAALCHVLSDADRVLSLDCDTVAVRDCTGAFDIDLNGCYFAGAQESWINRPGTQYTNVGVSLHNLDMLRDGKADEVIGVLNSRCYRWPEQDVLNYLCNGRIAPMPPEYNWCPWVCKSGTETPAIIHYAARDDWRDEQEVRKYRAMTWDEALERHGGRV